MEKKRYITPEVEVTEVGIHSVMQAPSEIEEQPEWGDAKGFNFDDGDVWGERRNNLWDDDPNE